MTMDAATIATYSGATPGQVQRFFTMTGEAIILDESYQALLAEVDKDLLEETLDDVRAIYDRELPAFQDTLEKRYDVNTAPMSAYTLGNWVVGALAFPQYTNSLVDMHKGVPNDIFLNELPILLEMVGQVPRAGREWQRALCLFAIPLMRG